MPASPVVNHPEPYSHAKRLIHHSYNYFFQHPYSPRRPRPIGFHSTAHWSHRYQGQLLPAAGLELVQLPFRDNPLAIFLKSRLSAALNHRQLYPTVLNIGDSVGFVALGKDGMFAMNHPSKEEERGIYGGIFYQR